MIKRKTSFLRKQASSRQRYGSEDASTEADEGLALRAAWVVQSKKAKAALTISAARLVKILVVQISSL
jgi:hypothetical protein